MEERRRSRRSLGVVAGGKVMRVFVTQLLPSSSSGAREAGR